MRKAFGVLWLIVLFSILGAECHKIGNYNLYEVENMVVEGNLLYAGGARTEMTILDISSAPTQIAMYPLEATAMVPVGSLLYAVGNGALTILDMTTPCAPQEVGAYTPFINPLGLAVSDTMAYVVDGLYGLSAIDIANPQQPHLLGTYALPSYAQTVAAVGTTLYVPDNDQGLLVIDASNPAEMYLRNTLETVINTQAMAVNGAVAYLACGSNGMAIVDLSDTLNPQLLGTYADIDYAISVKVESNTAYLMDPRQGLMMIDVSVPQSPHLIGQYSTLIESDAVAVFGSVAYVADMMLGLQIIDISEPYNAALVGSYLTSDQINAVTVEGTNAYLANSTGLEIVDVTDPQHPYRLGGYDTFDAVLKVVVKESTAYFTSSDHALTILDVSNPQEPQLVSTFDDDSNDVCDVAIEGTTVYLCEMTRLVILDVADPLHPQCLGSFEWDYEGHRCNIAISGTTVYISAGFLLVLDAADPSAPEYRGFSSGYGLFNHIAYSGSTLYGGSTGAGCLMIDASDPTNPTVMESLSLRELDCIGAVLVQGNRLFVSNTNWNDISVFDITNPQQPLLINNYQGSFPATGICASNDLLYTVGESCGLRILHQQVVDTDDSDTVPTATLCLSNFPNPFNPTTTIAYSLPKEGKVTLSVYNLRGQLVKQLVNESQTTGKHQVLWNGTNNSGQTVATGVYFYRLETNHNVITKKMLLMK